jgi:hypothetical protein
LGSPLDNARLQNLFRFTTFFGEGHGGQHLKQRVAIRIQGPACKNEPFGPDNLLVYARHGIDGAVGAPHVNKNGAAGP